MGKMLLALILIFSIELAMALFVAVPGEGSESTSLFTFLLNMEDWDSTQFLEWLFSDITLLGGVAIVVGTFFTRQDWIWRAAMVIATFLTFGSVIASLYTFIGAGLLAYIEAEMARNLVTLALVGPLTIYFVMVSIDFISGKD